jgi:hypothetical protein
VSNEKACHGIGCQQHTLCARYHAVEIEPDRERMPSCNGGQQFILMGQPTPAHIDDDSERQVQWGQG